MTDFRAIANPARLKATAVSAEELSAIKEPIQSAIGTAIAPDRGPTQLDLRYLSDRTVVTAAGGPDALRHWSFTGAVSPQDALSHFQANFAPADTEASEAADASATVEET